MTSGFEYKTLQTFFGGTADQEIATPVPEGTGWELIGTTFADCWLCFTWRRYKVTDGRQP